MYFIGHVGPPLIVISDWEIKHSLVLCKLSYYKKRYSDFSEKRAQGSAGS
jgi:hypothetical protein